MSSVFLVHADTHIFISAFLFLSFPILQPTLHKPGIMAHRVRILHNPAQKTIRMHYANCNTYNADFDGDEMNCHFPQSDLARAEAQYIAKTDLQYIVPTDGSPLRGLIQDHVVAGVKLTKKDTFIGKAEYQQLLFAALASLPGLEVIESDMDIELVPPAIFKPRELWTGKQVITTLLLHLRKGKSKDSATLGELPGISTSRKSKTPGTAFGSEQEEHLVLIRDGELLRGVLDKAAYGSTDFSLVHAVFEAYGPEKAGLLLNSLGRLFTAYIQFYSGHSCRMEDLILTKEADAARQNLVQRAYNIGSRAAKAWADSEGGKVAIPSVKDQAGSERALKPVDTALASAKIGQLLSGNEGAANFANLDGYMQGQLNPLASEIVKTCLPGGLAVPFPYNTFSVMTTTGAKGSIVNQSQVTCALGQQALEGRRVPRLSSGRTLPSFAPFDPNPRADGFVMDRFLTGIRPQEYYFHCMAGREGLVDTAVKTSRSGYLQRCLMKHLEELKLCYDYTVRNAEGGVIQFLYGEDGLDPTKASYLDCTEKSFEFMARNHNAIARQNVPLPLSTIETATADAERRDALEGDTATPPRPFAKGNLVRARKLRVGAEWKRGTLCVGWHEAIITKIHKKGRNVDLKYVKDGQTSKHVPVEADLGRCGGRKTAAWSSTATIVKAAVADPILMTPDRGHRLGSSGTCVSERVAKAASDAMQGGVLDEAMKSNQLSKKKLGALVAAKYSSSLCSPGEAVGSIAAQSIGEPSTQMTLNTFHLAGAGANVTLGIPRLREIIMTASRVLKTPTMSVPLHANVSEKKAVRMTRFFTKLTLMELISGNKGISVTERLEKGDAGNWERAYYVVIKLHPAERVREAFGLSLVDVARVVAKNYVPLLTKMMKEELKRSAVGSSDASDVLGGGSSKDVDVVKTGDDEGETGRPSKSANFVDELDDDNEGDDDDDAPGEEDGVEASRHRRRKESVSYEDDEDDESTDGQPAQTIMDEAQEDDASDDPPESTAMVFERKDHPTVNQRDNTISLQPLKVDPSARPLLMVGLIEKAASVILVRSRNKIDQAFINEEDDGRGRCFQTAGINFSEIWELDNVDHNRLMSNDIWAVRCAYGVEAARSSIGNQVRSVFGMYGIEVDPRHLSLISDYMTHEGGFKAMNRIGIEGSSSTLLQMSFETTVHFLRQSAIRNTRDTLDSPSANIVMGRPIRHGTGAFSLLSK
jgi:DNA-directed RNA polymerase I subunit RPA1